MNKITSDLRYILHIENGPICGYVDKNSDGTYYKFKSIPYAKPPVGDLRFKVSNFLINKVLKVPKQK